MEGIDFSEAGSYYRDPCVLCLKGRAMTVHFLKERRRDPCCRRSALISSPPFTSNSAPPRRFSPFYLFITSITLCAQKFGWRALFAAALSQLQPPPLLTTTSSAPAAPLFTCADLFFFCLKLDKHDDCWLVNLRLQLSFFQRKR